MVMRQETMIMFAREAIGIGPDEDMQFIPLAGRGSDRSYFRLRWGTAHSAILVSYDPRRIENTYYDGITRFLQANEIPVPAIMSHDPHRCLMIQEDLGDTDLWSMRTFPWETRKSMYRKTLAVAHSLHGYPEESFPADRVKLTEAFGPDLYRWERHYFLDHFVRDLCALEHGSIHAPDLENELAQLADRLSGYTRSLVHRDLQSQNVLIRDDTPFLIDFQGMRFGNRFYDLASLLCDPYVSFTAEERGELLYHYYQLSSPESDWNDFEMMFWEASVQRLMQALGAYGYLGRVRRLTGYFCHIPQALRNLVTAVENVHTLPVLSDLCGKCRNVLETSATTIR
jgi:N-acetylmuramate 1-kinase